MRCKNLKRKIRLSQKDFDEIRDAVAEEEKKSSGEIVLAITAESANYSGWEFLVAFFCAFALFICMMPLSPRIYLWLENHFAGVRPWTLSLFFAVVCTVLMLLILLLCCIPSFDRLIIPLGVRQKNVSDRAMRYFIESGASGTKKRTGVLIFVSYMEREVRIVGDSGIKEKVSQDLWNLIADEVSENLSAGNVKEAYLLAIKRCGDLLAQNFPEDGGENELPDGLNVLEDERWV